MKLLLDFFPILLFFIAYKVYDIYAATVVAIAASVIQVAWVRWRHGRFETMHLITLGLILVFGGATLLLHDKQFIMWKPTVINWLFGGAFLASQLFGQQTLVQRLMGETIAVTRPVWRRLNLAWTLFFFAVGAANLLVAQQFFQAETRLEQAVGSAVGEVNGEEQCQQQFQGENQVLCLEMTAREEAWVNFKLFGMLGLTIVFVIGQAFYLARHIQDPAPTSEEEH